MRIEITKYNDVWLDNGLATYYELLKELFEDELLSSFTLTDEKFEYEINDLDEFIVGLSESITGKTKRMVVEVEDKKTNERKEIKKEHILIQEGKKIGGKVAFKESIYNSENSYDILVEAFKNITGHKYRCFFCSRTFNKRIKKLQQASYPFVTKISSLSGIRSGASNKLPEYITEYCPQCYLLGVLEWLDDSIIYRNLPNDKSIIILPNTESIEKLIKIKRNYKKLLNNDHRWSNIRIEPSTTEIENTPGKYTTFISFYENFIRYVEPQFINDNWYIIEIPSGQVKNPKYFNILLDTKISNVLELLINQEKKYFYRTFIKQFYTFYLDPKKGARDFETENSIREILCEALIMNDFREFAGCFVPRKGIKPGISKEAYEVLNKLIYYWRIQPMKTENKEEYLKNIGMAGSTLAKLIDTRLGLFFKLEKAKNPNQLLDALQEITRRVIIDAKEESGIYTNSLEKVSKMVIENYDQPDGREFFETTKNLLLIYTSLRSHKENKNKKENSNE